jgi:hypothetical protein
MSGIRITQDGEVHLRWVEGREGLVQCIRWDCVELNKWAEKLPVWREHAVAVLYERPTPSADDASPGFESQGTQFKQSVLVRACINRRTIT